MDKEIFLQLLQRSATINFAHIEDFKSIVTKHPYFQSARVLHLKALKDHGSFSYNKALRVTAAHTTDRSILFDYITSKVFEQQLISDQQRKNQLIEVVGDAEVLIDIPVVNKYDTSVTEDNLFAAVTPENEKEVAEQNLQINKPLEFSRDDKYSFQEWLRLSSLHKIQREPKTEVVSNKEDIPEVDLEKASKDEIIDRFIANKPKIKPVKKGINLKNLASQSKFNSEELMTETLAKVYLAQSNYKQAKQAYRILSLKYPEKSSLFALRISEIEKLEKNK